MAQINPTAGHINRPLTRYAIAYLQQTFVADLLFPIVEVESPSDTYKIFNESNANRVLDLRIGAKQEPGELDSGSTSALYKVEDYGLLSRVPIAAQKAEDEPALLKQQTITANVMGTIMTNREVRAAAVAFNPANYATANKVALATGQGWNNQAVDPFDTLLDAGDAIRESPNTRRVAVFSPNSWKALRKNAKALTRVSGGATTINPSDVTKVMVAGMLEVDEVVVARAYKTATNPGQADVSTRVWGDAVAIIQAHTSPDTESVHFGSTFRYYTPEVVTKLEELRGVRGVWVTKIAMSEDIRPVSNVAGYLISNVLGA